MKSVSSAFYAKMQGDGIQMAALIDLETSGGNYHWTTANGEIFYTLSGTNTKYSPFPGQTLNGGNSKLDLSVSAIEFVAANTGSLLANLLDTAELDFATIKVGRVFVDTPDLGRMDIFQGRIGDYSYDRNTVGGSARNRWNSANVNWPYYNYQDRCAWRFGGTGCGYDTSSVTQTFSAGNIVTGSTTTLAIRFVNSTISASYANGRFDFGRLTVTNGPNSGNIRTIRSHSGDLFQLSHELPVNSFSTFGFTIYPGCKKRKTEDCTSLYNNAANFLGFPWIPIQEDAFGG